MRDNYFKIIVDGPFFDNKYIDITGYLYYSSADGIPFFAYWTEDMVYPDNYCVLDLTLYHVYFVVSP